MDWGASGGGNGGKGGMIFMSTQRPFIVWADTLQWRIHVVLSPKLISRWLALYIIIHL